MSSIGIDIDEVLSASMSGFLSYYNSKHGTNHTYEKMTEFSYVKIFGISNKKEEESLNNFFSSSYFLHLKTLPGSKKAIKRLSVNNKLHAISSRPIALAEITSLWLDEHYSGCFEDIILINSSVDSTLTKSNICKNKEIDYFIEDQIQFATDCASVCKTVFLMDKPWNRVKIESHNIIRVHSWAEITDKIERDYPLP